MRANRIFRAIWRIDGVIFLLTFAVAGGVILADAASSSLFRRHVQPVADSADSPGGEQLGFGSLEPLEGTRFVVLPLGSRRGDSSSFSGEDAGRVRNLLFYDTQTGETRWLRSGHSGVVVEHQELRERGADKGPVRWLRYEIADRDTDGDGEVSAEDGLQVAISGPGGDDLSVLLRDVRTVRGYAFTPRGTLLVFHRKEKGEMVAEIDLAARKVVRSAPLPSR
jgi:hypothetical protein